LNPVFGVVIDGKIAIPDFRWTILGDEQKQTHHRQMVEIPVSSSVSRWVVTFPLPVSADFCEAQRQTARRLPEANAGCLSRNRRLFDERNGASHRGRDFKDMHRKSSGWRRAVQMSLSYVG
jgi:hypothetical protein